MSLEYSNLIADAQTRLPGAIQSQIDADMEILVRDFLQITSVWQVDYEVAVTQGVDCYVVTPQLGTAINFIHNLFDAHDAHRRSVLNGGYSMDVPGHIKLYCAPSQDATWVATMSQYPIRCSQPLSTPVPGYILVRYYDTLLNGLLGRMMIQPKKTYTDPATAGMHARAYVAGRARAQADLARSNVWGTQQWVFPQATLARSRQVGP